MRLRIKNKGFSLVEIIIVVAIIAVLAGITIGHTGDIQQKAELEKKAEEIRDFFLQVGATASRTQQDIYVKIDDKNRLIAYYRAKQTGAFDNHADTATDDNVVKNFEGGGALIVNLGSMDYSMMRTTNNGQLFSGRNSDDGSLILNTSYSQHIFYIFSSRRIGYSSGDSNKYCIIRRGHYWAIIEIDGTGNMNLYTSDKTSEKNATNKIRFYSMK